jgi:hypothetical protein
LGFEHSRQQALHAAAAIWGASVAGAKIIQMLQLPLIVLLLCFAIFKQFLLVFPQL